MQARRRASDCRSNGIRISIRKAEQSRAEQISIRKIHSEKRAKQSRAISSLSNRQTLLSSEHTKASQRGSCGTWNQGLGPLRGPMPLHDCTHLPTSRLHTLHDCRFVVLVSERKRVERESKRERDRSKHQHAATTEITDTAAVIRVRWRRLLPSPAAAVSRRPPTLRVAIPLSPSVHHQHIIGT